MEETNFTQAENSEGILTSAGYVPETPAVFTGHEKTAALVTFPLAFGAVHLILWHTTGLLTSVLFAAIITLMVIFMKKSGSELRAGHKMFAAVLYVFSAVFTVTANSFIKTLDVVFLTLGCGYLLYLIGSGKGFFGKALPFELLKSTVQDPLTHFSKQYSAVNSTMKGSRAGRDIRNGLLGALLAVPLTAVVADLLISADRGMEKMLGLLTTNLNGAGIFRLIVQAMMAIPAAGYIYGMMYSHLAKNCKPLNDEACEEFCSRARRISRTVLYTAVTPICLLYAMFFVSQANYFLSAFLGKLPEGYSFAEYARKGFFELFDIQLINAGVIFVMNAFSKREEGKKPAALKVYTLIISFFTLVITATALSKMFLYISSYGLTQLRVYTSWFMVLTALMFVFVMIKQLRPGFRAMRAAAATFILMFGLLCFSRPDALIAKYDLTCCRDTITAHDITMLSEMSLDSAAVVTDPQYRELIYDKFSSSAGGGARFISSLRNASLSDPYARLNLSAYLMEVRK